MAENESIEKVVEASDVPEEPEKSPCSECGVQSPCCEHVTWFTWCQQIDQQY